MGPGLGRARGGPMGEFRPQTGFVRRALEGRDFGFDAMYARDLVELERSLASPFLGMAGFMARANLVSRYPRQADAILRELGVAPFIPTEEARLATLAEERLRLAELRHRPWHLQPDEPMGLFES